MFEKEAEEIMMQKVIKENDCIMTPCKTLEDCQLYDFCFDDMVAAFKDGAEFGYNKANEWHYVKDGKCPTHSNRVLVFTDEGVGFGLYGLDDKKWHTYDTGFDVIAWKEIVLSELLKEIK